MTKKKRPAGQDIAELVYDTFGRELTKRRLMMVYTLVSEDVQKGDPVQTIYIGPENRNDEVIHKVGTAMLQVVGLPPLEIRRTRRTGGDA